MAVPAKDETITISVKDLEAMFDRRLNEANARSTGTDVAKIAAEVMRSTMGLSAQIVSLEERVHAHLGTPVPERKPSTITHQRCCNQETGATWTAVIVPSRTFAKGRVKDIIDYRYPADIAIRARGMVVSNPDSTGDPTVPGKSGLTTQFLQWRYETYDLADRRQYVGKSAQYLPRLEGPEGEPFAIDTGESARTFAA